MMNFKEQLDVIAEITILCCGENEYNTLNNIFENIDTVSLFNLKDFNEIDVKEKSNKEEIVQAVRSSDISFVTITSGEEQLKLVHNAIQMCKNENVHTVGVGIKPALIEDVEKRKYFNHQIKYLKNQIDNLILIDNEKLINGDIILEELKELSNKALEDVVGGIINLITLPGIVNLDTTDVKVILNGNALSYVGIGNAIGDNRAAKAAKEALSSPLLCEPIHRAKSIILNITAGIDLGLLEINEIAELVQEAAMEEANIIFGAVIDESVEGVKVVIITSGYEDIRRLTVVK
ncbi:hypothetical protein [Oceanirhabdus seepicola]|uniref:Tubulin/FtsZ 2-layer sandwich domain-containing protein n=1 Tax=Oceanirhabdus seepicola TaxID=2828781 RepID=A0A9J6NX05_9CLOT|nr:hypothetical protein [Oceanirhabdus seepicola]MCM1988795.1 hypothetical protein [Oceanirhabdus seepicola]